MNPNMPSVSLIRSQKFFLLYLLIICDETIKNGTKYFAVIAATINENVDKYLIYLNVGDYCCDALFVISCIEEN